MQKEKNPTVFLETEGFLNPDHIINSLQVHGYYGEDNEITRTLIANATFPMRDFLSFSLWEEIPSQNGNQKENNSYSFWHKQTRGENFDIPMCMALIQHVYCLRDNSWSDKTFIIKTPLFVNKRGRACYLAWLEGSFAFQESGSCTDVEDVEAGITWISANHVRKKCI